MGVGSVTSSSYDAYGYSTSGYLEGVGEVPVSQEEMTSSKLVSEYKKWLEEIKRILNKQPPTSEDLQALQQAVNKLADLAKNGDQSTKPPSYMQPEMIKNLNNVFTLLAKGNIVPGGTINESEALLGLDFLRNYRWTAPDGKTVVTFAMILDAAINLSGSDKSLQAMLYSDFVVAANNEFNSKLQDLKNALEAIKGVGDILAEIQNYRNRMITAPGTPAWKDGNQVGTPPQLGPLTDAEMAKLKELYDKLKEKIAYLKTPPPDGPGIPDKEGTLTNSLQKVADSLKFLDKSKPSTDDLKNWLYDNWNAGVGGNAGAIQDTLTKAITDCTNLNDTQKEELRSIQYSYEQFIKIATELLQLLNKLMEGFTSKMG